MRKGSFTYTACLWLYRRQCFLPFHAFMGCFSVVLRKVLFFMFHLRQSENLPAVITLQPRQDAKYHLHFLFWHARRLSNFQKCLILKQCCFAELFYAQCLFLFFVRWTHRKSRLTKKNLNIFAKSHALYCLQFALRLQPDLHSNWIFCLRRVAPPLF